MFNALAGRLCRLLPIAVLLLASDGAAGGLAPGVTLCMYPLGLPFPTGDHDPRRASIERRLTAALLNASLRVVEPARVKVVRDRELGAEGGIFDPVLGRPIPEKYRAYHDRIAAAFARELGCDAQLIASVVPVRASFATGVAKWDGASQQISSTGRIVLQALGGEVESGWVGAFSLWLLVRDLAGNDLTFRSAGIEALVRLAVIEDKDLLPQDQWLTDGAKLDAAIASALGSAGRKLLGNRAD